MASLSTINAQSECSNVVRSIRRDVNPEPVPPPKEWNIKNPCKPFSNLPTTVGSKSTKTALGTCFPAPVSLKNVLKLSSPPPSILSEGICPSG
ncbi:GSCOCG00007402001-RA-CDS [Cotesia congregata]|nr:GSCOCG00007402001-RA-CDS [Cotesia congregata]